MKLHTCAAGHLTAFKDCKICKGEAAKVMRRALRVAKEENKELKRQVRNLTEAIQAARAF